MTIQAAIQDVFALMSVPQTWLRTERSIEGFDHLIEYKCPEDNVSLSILDRGWLVNDESARYFKDLLASNSSLSVPKVLRTKQLARLTKVMGKAGDNQYTNKTPFGNFNAPWFSLSFVQLISVNGKTVL